MKPSLLILLRNGLLLILSVGWVVPFILAAISYDRWVRNLVLSGETEMHSFPYHQASSDFFIFGSFWFCTVLLVWGIYIAFIKPSRVAKQQQNSLE